MSSLEIPSAPPLPPTHKRRQVADSLRQMISVLQPGDRLPSLTDLEKHFGFAKATIEAAVGQLQAEGLVIRRHGAGTFVAAAPPVSARTGVGRLMITCLPLGQSLDIFASMTAAVEGEMRRCGYDPILHFENNVALRLQRAQERWDARNIDGYIHIGSVSETTVFPNVPGVVIGEAAPDALVHQVTVDNYAAGRRAGQYLWEMGHRHIACLSIYHLLPSAQRYQGLVDAVREAGAPFDATTFVPVGGVRSTNSKYPSLFDALQTLLAAPAPPTALFFANDQIAFPGLQFLLSLGYRVPSDLSVLSFDDTPGLASQTLPALTSLRMPTLALGALAVQTLHEAISETVPFRRVRLPAELIVRESSGAAPGSGYPSEAPP